MLNLLQKQNNWRPLCPLQSEKNNTHIFHIRQDKIREKIILTFLKTMKTLFNFHFISLTISR